MIQSTSKRCEPLNDETPHTMPSDAPVRQAAILAGGAGSRIGGGKPHRRLGDRSLLDRVSDALAERFPRPILSLAAGQSEPNDWPGEVVRDAGGGEGPLRALEAIFDRMARTDSAGRVLVLACDYPLATAEVVAWLCDRVAKHPAAEAWIPVVDGRRQTLAAVYSLSVLPTLRKHLAAGERKLGRFVDTLAARELDADGFAAQFANINTPEQLASAEATLRGRGEGS